MGRSKDKIVDKNTTNEIDNKSSTTKNTSKKKLSLEERQDINLEKHIKRLNDRQEELETRPTENFYCTNKSLTEELIKWRDSDPDPEKRVASNNLGLMIKHIATKLSNHSNFRNYPIDIKEEMISYATYKILKGLVHYRFEFKNPFAYITQGCWNAFVTVCGKYYKQINLKRDYAKRFLGKLEEIEGINVSKIYNAYFKNYIGDENEEGLSDENATEFENLEDN